MYIYIYTEETCGDPACTASVSWDDVRRLSDMVPAPHIVHTHMYFHIYIYI